MPTRRFVAASLCTLAAATLAPRLTARPVARAATRPRRLREGDTVGLVAPAGFIADRFGVEAILESIRAVGLVPRPAAHLAAREGYLAGDDRTRAAEFQAMFEDPSVAAVMSVRGGWGSARILPYLDFARIARNPKLFSGFSDNTALHMALAARCGFPTIHGPNASGSWHTGSWETFRALAFDGATPTISVPVDPLVALDRGTDRLRTFRGGKARGRLLGGNLTVLAALVGTPYLPDFTGAILFLEDTNESEYRIDRMLTQLALAGILSIVAGVVFGQCSNCVERQAGYGNFTVYQVMDRAFGALGVPAFQGLSFGHVAGQACMAEGTMAEIDADAGTVRLLEPVVA